MSILNWQVNSSSIFASSIFVSLSWHITPHQSPNFETFKCSGENFPNSSCFLNHKLVFLQILNQSLVSWKITPLYVFRSNIAKKNQSKCKFLRLLSAQIKIQQIFVIFETKNHQFSVKFFYRSWVPSNIIRLYFLSWSIIYFRQKQPIN